MMGLWNDSEVFNEKYSGTQCVDLGVNASEIISKVGSVKYLVMGNDRYNSYGGTFKGVELMYAPTSSGLPDA